MQRHADKRAANKSKSDKGPGSTGGGRLFVCHAALVPQPRRDGQTARKMTPPVWTKSNIYSLWPRLGFHSNVGHDRPIFMTLRVSCWLAASALTAQFLSPALAAAQQPAAAPENAAAPEALDPNSPLADIPDIGVDWPDLPAEEAGEPSAQLAQPDAEERRYTVILAGVPSAPENQIAARFETLSRLKTASSRLANLAQINRRARDDEALLEELLRADGYYDARITSRVEAVADRIAVTFTVTPGALYRFDEIRVSGLDDVPDGRPLFAVRTSDPVDADTVTAGTAALLAGLRNQGYPFAVVAEPDVTVDHDTETGTLDLAVNPGGLRRFGQILASGDRAPFGSRHMSVIARFKPGDLYRQSDVEDLKRAIVATGLVSSVTITPIEGAAQGSADLSVATTPAPPRTIAGEIGYGTGEGARVAASWTHRNLIGPEGALTLAGVAGTKEQSLRAGLRMSNWQRRDWILNARVGFSNIVQNAYEARTLQVGASLERQTNLLWQKPWTWNAGFELAASQERDVVSGNVGRNTYFIGALPAQLAYDGSDNLLDPERGFRMSGRISPEISFQGAATSYIRAQLDASAYLPLGNRVVVGGRVRLGSILGSKTRIIAPSRRFYAGGGGSVRGYGYQAIGPRDEQGDPAGGRSLSEFAIEARIRFGAFGLVPFLDAGNLYTASVPRLTNLRFGTGLGVRYYSSFGPLRIDVGTPINRRSGESRVGIYVSLGQAF